MRCLLAISTHSVLFSVYRDVSGRLSAASGRLSTTLHVCVVGCVASFRLCSFFNASINFQIDGWYDPIICEKLLCHLPFYRRPFDGALIIFYFYSEFILLLLGYHPPFCHLVTKICRSLHSYSCSASFCRQLNPTGQAERISSK